jgi:ABC-type lipoprotein release transport system permease subunit
VSAAVSADSGAARGGRATYVVAVLLAGAVVLAQAGLARLLSFVPAGTRALGTGASVSTALFILAGYTLGRFDARRRGGPDDEGWRPVPWGPGTVAALVQSGLGLVGWLLGGLDALFPPGALGEGGIATAMLATDAVLFAPFALTQMGAALGANTRRRTTTFGVLGAAALFGIALGLRRLARELVLDPGAIGVLTTVGVGVAALAVGFGLAWARRRLAFVEMAIVALVFGYALYLGVATGPPELVAAWSLPIEQILLALSIVPSIAVMALLAVGGSLGFLLFGSGALDAGFGYELLVAKRYLQVNLRGTRRGVASFAAALLSLLLALGVGAAGYGRAGAAGAAGGSLGVLAVGVSVWPFFRGYPKRGAALLALTLAVGGGAWLALGWWGLAAVGALGTALGSALRGRLPEHRRRPPFVGVVSIISVVGVALGVTALIVVLSVMSGFEEDLKSKILGAHAHVVVEKYGDDFLEYEAVEEKIRAAPRVQSAAAFVLGDAMISTDGGLSGALVKGIDPRSSDAVGELRENLERGRVEYLLEPKKIPGACGRSFLPPRPPVPVGGSSTSATVAEPLVPGGVALGGSAECTGRVLPGIIVGKELARTLRAQVGDAVKLVSPVSDEIGPLGPTPKLRRYRVAGIFYSGMYEYDAKLAYVAMKRAQKFFGMRGKATGVETKIDDIDASGLVVSDLERRLGGRPYRVKDWREMNKELFSALLLEKIAMFVALTMIITVASFLIVATLVMIVLQRGREIAILKSVGASAASVMKIFVIQGVIVGVGGALLGVGAGVGICLLLETVGLRLDERVFYIEQLPVVLDWTEVGIIAASAMVITYLATIYPAMTAAILRPVDGLRED